MNKNSTKPFPKTSNRLPSNLRPSELFSLLKALKIRPKKGLSQNFLIDGNILQKIIQLAEVQEGDSILEIGPGLGSLTSLLLAQKAKVYAIEKDRRLVQALLRFGTEKFLCFEADALKFPFETLPSPLKVVANLPYHIATPLLEKLFSAGAQFSSFTIMVQKEVAQRLCAKAKTKEFSALTVFAQFHTQYKGSFPVKAHSFYPRPKIESTVIRLDRQNHPLEGRDKEAFFTLVRRAFQQRRKMIRTSLKSFFEPSVLEEALFKSSGNKEARPEALCFAEWLSFYTLLKERGENLL